MKRNELLTKCVLGIIEIPRLNGIDVQCDVSSKNPLDSRQSWNGSVIKTKFSHINFMKKHMSLSCFALGIPDYHRGKLHACTELE